MVENGYAIVEQNYNDLQSLKSSLINACRKKVERGEIVKVAEYVTVIAKLDDIMGRSATYYETFVCLQNRRFGTEINVNDDDLVEWAALVEEIDGESIIGSNEKAVPKN